MALLMYISAKIRQGVEFDPTLILLVRMLFLTYTLNSNKKRLEIVHILTISNHNFLFGGDEES